MVVPWRRRQAFRPERTRWVGSHDPEPGTGEVARSEVAATGSIFVTYVVKSSLVAEKEGWKVVQRRQAWHGMFGTNQQGRVRNVDVFNSWRSRRRLRTALPCKPLSLRAAFAVMWSSAGLNLRGSQHAQWLAFSTAFYSLVHMALVLVDGCLCMAEAGEVGLAVSR